jgi:cytidylate kinase
MKSTTTSSHDLSMIAERQMRTWALGLQTREKLDEQRAAAAEAPQTRPYIAISRQAGIDADEIARLVGAQSHWKVLDRALLDYMAEQHHWSRMSLDVVDERTASWFNDTIGTWLDRQMVSQVEYVHHLARIVILAARHENMVFVGRGAQFLLPREQGLTVRLFAPRKARAKRLAAQQHLSEAEAERQLDSIDDGRANFVKRYFHRDVRDPNLYDLLLNVEHFSDEAAAELVLLACRVRFG